MKFVQCLPFVLLSLCGDGFGLSNEPSTDCNLSQAHYQGWQTQRLANGLVELHVVPELGGRLMQFQCGNREFLWVNPQLAGKLSPPSGLGDDGSWLNYGGDKLWPAPQGWDNDEQWPGPPDAVLDGQPYTFEREVLSPFARLEPGQSYDWSYDWYATNVGGDFPVVDCTSVGVVAQPLSATVASGQVSLQGRFGVFVSGAVCAEFCDAAGQILHSLDLSPAVSPLQPLVLDTVVATPTAAALVKLVVRDERAKLLGELARSDLR